MVTAASQLHVPAAMDETNSTVCGGTPGVSNVFASALWALDYNLLMAQTGVANADFEGGISGCVVYSPLCQSTDGTLAAQPLYYGMLATSLVGTGNFVSVTNSDFANVRAYAVRSGGDLTVVLDNVQDPSSNGPATVDLSLGATFQQGQMAVLKTSSAAGLSASTGITLGGQQVGTDGSFPAPTFTPVTVTGQNAVVNVNAGSAAIIRFSSAIGERNGRARSRGHADGHRRADDEPVRISEPGRNVGSRCRLRLLRLGQLVQFGQLLQLRKLSGRPRRILRPCLLGNLVLPLQSSEFQHQQRRADGVLPGRVELSIGRAPLWRRAGLRPGFEWAAEHHDADVQRPVPGRVSVGQGR